MNRHLLENEPEMRKSLLITEFSSLAVLLASMAWFGNQQDAGQPIGAGWLLIPALASLALFLSFIGLMYLRWVAAAAPERQTRHRIVFALLTLTLLGVWLYAVGNTWVSLNASA
ncbi:MAG: hypothetical protein HLX50_06690 [Alteromonadaceae bacterium]|nr:hypothetical protein [Alteromonadaceae bacterium]